MVPLRKAQIGTTKELINKFILFGFYEINKVVVGGG
jgi:hypothetical protein